MKITILKEDGGMPVVIDAEEFPALNKMFQDNVGAKEVNTIGIEVLGAGLMKDGCDDVDRANDFLRLIFNWGSGNGRFARATLYKNHSRREVAKTVGEAAALLHKNELKAALEKITSLKGLGIAFGSKILRMLSPKQAAVGAYTFQESGGNITLETPKNSSIADYIAFCEFCKTVIIAELKKANIKNPRREKGEWFVADIEAVMTCREKGYA